MQTYYNEVPLAQGKQGFMLILNRLKLNNYLKWSPTYIIQHNIDDALEPFT